MANPLQRQYLETQVRTSSPEELLLMLFDGAVRFCEQAKAKIDAKDIEGSYEALVRAQKIVLEVMCALDKGVGEEVYGNLIGLYRFVYLRLVNANVTKDKKQVDEAVEILLHLRETWRQAVLQARKDGPARKPQKLRDGPAGAALSIQG